jgi:Cu(I)/Ag(I) efflux system periplasmic protein CusF
MTSISIVSQPLRRTSAPGLIAALLALALGVASAAASAQQDHALHAAPAKAASTATVMTKGIVRNVDAKAGTITIKHEHIVNIDMAPMTMVFKAAKPGLLEGVRKDDQIRFHAEEPGGVLTVTAIEVLRAK